MWSGGSRGKPDTTLTLCKPSDIGSLAMGGHILGEKSLMIAYTQIYVHTITYHRNNSKHKHNPQPIHPDKQAPTQLQPYIQTCSLSHRHPSTNTLTHADIQPHTNTSLHRHPLTQTYTYHKDIHRQTQMHTNPRKVTSLAQTHIHTGTSLQIPMPHTHYTQV